MRLLLITYVLLTTILFCHGPAQASVTVTVNGSNHTIPQTNEKGWGTNVTAWIQAISQYTLQPNGGTFTLTADTNFGSSYGLISPYYKSSSGTLASAGVLRLNVSDDIAWRNNADDGNLLLSVDSSNRLTFNSAIVSTATTATFDDSVFSLYDNGDNTKLLAFQVSGITTGTTRTLTVPDASTTIVGTDTTQTLTNKTLTTPVISSISNSGTLTLPTSSDTLVGRATTDTLTNKTLTAPVISTISNTGTLTLPTSTDTLVGRDTTDTLTNKTLTSPVINTGVSGTAILDEDNMASDSATKLATQQSIKAYADTKVAKSSFAAKGDLLAGTGSGTLSAVTAGTNGYILAADSAQSAGIKWVATPGYHYQLFTSTSTFTFPSGTVSGTVFKVTLCGAGGGGGGGNASSGGAGGGAGGAVAIKYLSGVTAGNNITVTIGSAGSAGGAGATGGTGGDAVISSGTETITTVTAAGGTGGIGNSSASFFRGGTGGAATNGDINIKGQGGGFGAFVSTSGWGGMGGGPAGGRGGDNNGGTVNGTDGGYCSGGGGGGAVGGSSNGSGGAGGAPLVLVEWAL